MNPMKIFVPLTKIDEEQRLVYGVLAEERVDKSGEIFDYASSKPLFQAWSDNFRKATEATGQEPSLGNLRAMHESISAGKFTQVVFNDEDKRVEVCAKVVDDNEWEKTRQGVYTGFSIGGAYAKTWQDLQLGKKRYTANPAEGSLVDNPCMYGATFTAIKAEGAQELRKFVGDAIKIAKLKMALEAWDAAEASLKKDAVSAIGSANDAIASLKALAVELLSMPGEPDTWTLSDILAAIRYAIYGKVAAEGMAATDPEVPGAGPDEPATLAAAAAVDGLEKAEEIDMKSEDLAKVVTDALEKSLKPVTENVTKMQDAMKPEALHEAVKDGVAKTVESAVAKAVEPLAKAADVTALSDRVKKLEDVPAPVGTPIDKSVGTTPGGSNGTSEALSKLIEDQLAKAKEAGATPEQLQKARLEFTSQLIRASH